MQSSSNSPHNGVGAPDDLMSTEHESSGIQLFDIVGAVIRRWWLVILAIATGAIVAVVTHVEPVPQYTAQALVRKTPEETREILGIGAAPAPFKFQTENQILHSASVLGAAANALGLRVSIDTAGRGRDVVAAAVTTDSASSGQYVVRSAGDEYSLESAGGIMAAAPRGGWLVVPGMRILVSETAPVIEDKVILEVAPVGAQIARLDRALAVSQVPETDILRLQYTDLDPTAAAAIVNQIALEYQRFDGRESRREAQRRLTIIQDQIAEVSDSLDAARRQLMQHQVQTGASGGGTVQNELVAGEQELQQLKEKEARLQNVVNLLRGQDTSDEAFRRIAVLGSGVLPGADGFYSRMRDLETERRRLTASRFGYTASESRVVVLDSLLAAEQREFLAIAQQSLRLVNEDIARTQTQVEAMRGRMAAVPQRNALSADLTRTVSTVQGLYDQLANRQYEAQIAAGSEGGRVQIVDRAQPPQLPNGTGEDRRFFIAVMIGLFLGVFGAVVLDRLDSRITKAGDAERVTGLVTIGMLPRVPQGNGAKGESRLIGEADISGHEAYRMLRTSIRFSRAEPPRVMSVTSASPGEGKSSVAANLARVLSEEGGSTLVIDADLRRPVLNTTFSLPKTPGLTDVLVGTTPVKDAIRSKGQGLYVLTAGSASPRPTELLGSPNFAQLIKALREKFAHIIIDTPPVLAVADAAVVSSVVDSVLLVARVEHTTREALDRASYELRKIGAPLMGLVLNSVPQGGPFSKYGRYYGYYQYFSYAEYYQSENGAASGGNRLSRLFSKK